MKALSVSTTKLCILEGDAPKVTIKQGSGNYSVTSGNPSYVTVSVEESEITLTGVKEGTATVTVTDDGTFLTQDISITVVKAIPEVGEVYEGEVRSIMSYGASVEFMPGKEGLLHISEIDWKRVETVEEAGLKEGDKIQVKLIDIDETTGKFRLSRRVLMEKPALSVDVSEISVAESQTRTISIQQGSGSYSAPSGNPSYVTAFVQGSEITLTGVKEGTATVTVTDNETSLTQDISITVVKSLSVGVSEISVAESQTRTISTTRELQL